jgi:hypothetical protein
MKGDCKHVLLVGHDRGGVNLLVPLLAQWSEPASGIEATFVSTPTIEYEVAGMMDNTRQLLVERPKSLRPIKMAGSDAAHIGRSAWSYSERSLADMLESKRWDLVLTGTSLLSGMERTVWQLCKARNIASAAICDMWTEYQRRFRNGDRIVLPDVLLVIDERMAQEARAELGGAISIEVVGSPHFDYLMRGARKSSSERSVVRFISEPIAELFPDAGVHEFEVAKTLIETMRRLGQGAPLVLRPHPQDDSEGWRRFAYSYRDSNVRIDDEPSWACHFSTKMAIGMSSMMLIELAIAGVPVASFQPPGSDKSYYCLNESEFGIRIVEDVADLADWLAAPGMPRVSADFVALHRDSIARMTEFIRDAALAGRSPGGRAKVI